MCTVCRNFPKIVIMAVGGTLFGLVYLVKLVVSTANGYSRITFYNLKTINEFYDNNRKYIAPVAVKLGGGLRGYRQWLQKDN